MAGPPLPTVPARVRRRRRGAVPVGSAVAVLVAGVLTALLAGAGLAGERLLVTFFERPPYYYTRPDGVPAGSMLEETRRILEHAGLRYELRSVPASRILAEMEMGAEPQCSIGWFVTQERRRFAVFSLPFHRSEAQVAVGLPEVAGKLRRVESAQRLLERPDLRLGVVHGFSYGTALDRLLAASVRPVERVRGTPAQVLRMVASRRFDYTFADPEELPMLERAAGLHPGTLVPVPLPDVPVGNLRHLMCSWSVPAATLDRLDAAIRTLFPDLQESAAGPTP